MMTYTSGRVSRSVKAILSTLDSEGCTESPKSYCKCFQKKIEFGVVDVDVEQLVMQ